MQTDQLEPLERALEHRLVTHDVCVRCSRLIPSAFQLKNPGTDVCQRCSEVDEDKK